jgi:putative flippase GtrA
MDREGPIASPILLVWHTFSLVRFFWASSIAYAVDFSVYLLLQTVMLPEPANLISYSLGIAVNFALHRLIVFRHIRRTVATSLAISIVLSLIGLALSTGLIYLVRTYVVSGTLAPKIVATVVVFFWNYYSKKHVAFLATDRRDVDLIK